MRRALTVALAYATIASILSVGVEVRGGGALIIPLPLIPLKLIPTALLVLVIASIPLLREGFKELFRRLRVSRRSWLHDLVLMAIYLLLFASIFRLTYGLRGPSQLPQVNRSTLIQPRARGGGSEAGEATATAGELAGGGVRVIYLPETGGVPMMPLVALLMVVSLVTLAYAAWSSRERRVRGGSREALELLQAAEEAVRELEGGEDPRKAIVAYFLKLCSLLQRRRVDIKGSLTAREIAQLVRPMLSEKSFLALMRLVHLFEVARYSSHIVDEDMRCEALFCFTRIRDDLSSSGVEGAVA